MTPIVDGLDEEFAGQLTVYQLNAAEAAVITLQGQYGVRGHPSFALIDENGAVSDRFLGPQTESTLRTAINKLLTASD
ncbi:MAG: hypothetical protein KDE34_09730 [Anaerolineales bacterium]|nr:hypothetical protein [Anaerolineales bacterium]